MILIHIFMTVMWKDYFHSNEKIVRFIKISSPRMESAREMAYSRMNKWVDKFGKSYKQHGSLEYYGVARTYEEANAKIKEYHTLK